MNSQSTVRTLLALLLLPVSFASAQSLSNDWRPRLESRAGNSVDTATGAFIQEINLFNVPSVRELDLTLTYNSKLTAQRGDLGYGWTHQYEASIDSGEIVPETTYRWVTARLDALHPSRFDAQNLPEQDEWRTDLDYHDRLFRGPAPAREWQLERLDGTRYRFDGKGQLTRVFNKNSHQLFIERAEFGRDQDPKGKIIYIEEPVSGRGLRFFYRQTYPQKSDQPLLSSVSQFSSDGLNLAYRFLQYDDWGRLNRIYDPVEFESVGENRTKIAVPENANGAGSSVPVGRPDTNHLIRVQGKIAGITDAGTVVAGQPQTLSVHLTSPTGRRIDIGNKSDHALATSFEIDQVFDEFLDESLAGTWKLHVTDNADDGIKHAIVLFYIYAADEEANWTEFEYGQFPSKRIVRSTDSLGDQIFANTYDSSGRVSYQFDGRENNGFRRFIYDGSQTRVSLRESTSGDSGGYLTFVHDGNFNLLSMADALGNTTRFGYLPASIDRSYREDPRGNRTSYRYDALGHLIAMTEQNFALTSFDHTGNFLTSVRDGLKNSTSFDYDEFGRLTKVTNPKGDTQEWQFSDSGERDFMINKNGNGIQIEYKNGLPESAYVITEEDAVDQLEYDDYGRMSMATNADGNVTTYFYDNRGNLVEMKNTEDGTSLSIFDHRNRLRRTEDARGYSTTYLYDGNDNRIEIINPLQESTTFHYDAEDRLVSVRNGDGHEIETYAYDLSGRLITETKGGERNFYGYDRAGNRIRTASDTMTLSTTNYDKLNRPVRVKDSRGNETTFSYDLIGQQTLRTDPYSATTAFTFDKMNRIEAVTDPMDRISRKTFEDDDVVKELVYADSQKTSFAYTDRNQLKEITTPNGAVTQLEYTGSGFIKKFIPWSLTKAQEYTYDGAGRLERTRHTGFSEPDILYVYDANGNRTRISTVPVLGGEVRLKILRGYDELNRQTLSRNVVYPSSGGRRSEETRFVYNKAGYISEVVYPDDKRVKYTYDTFGRMVSVVDWAERVTAYTWGEGDQITEIRFPNGTVRVMNYSADRLLLHRTDYDAGGLVIVSYEYSYDANGFISAEQTGGAEPTAYQPLVTKFTYLEDDRMRLMGTELILYDADGNVERGPVNGQSAVLDWNQRNNLEKVGASETFSYDVEDRLIGWSNDVETRDFTVIEASGNSRILVSKDQAGPVTRYVYGVGLAYEDTDGEIRVYHYDQRGNTTAMTDASGRVSGTISYSPFGQIVRTTGDTDTIFKYGGLFGVVTAPNGLNYMRFRWYSPEMKRFISMDSRLGDIILPSSLNRFIYAANNPINFNDPDGEFWNVIVGAVAGATFGALTEIIAAGIQGEPVDWNNVASAALGGAVSGALAASGGVGFAIAGGALGSATENLTRSAFNGDKVDFGRLATGAVISGALGGAFGSYHKGSKAIQRGLSTGTGKKQFFAALRTEVGLNQKAGKEAAWGVTKKLGLKVVGGTTSNIIRDKFYEGEKSDPSNSFPGGNVGVIVGGVIGMPTKNIGQGGEYLHYQRYLDALIAADRPLPNPVENLATF